MKTLVRMVLATVVVVQSTVMQASEPLQPLVSDLATGANGSIPSTTTPLNSGKKVVNGDPVIVRGWEIQSVSALNQKALSDIFPEYNQKRPVGNRTSSVSPTKGTFLVVLVQCQSATGTSLNQPLWVGKPDVTLIDEVGLEYAPQGKLTQQGNQLVTQGMLTSAGNEKHRRAPGQTTSALVYFDVPASSQTFWLRFGESGPAIPVSRVQALPVIATE